MVPHTDTMFLNQVQSGSEAVTKATCADKAHWLGNSSAPSFTVVDTPGFGEDFR